MNKMLKKLFALLLVFTLVACTTNDTPKEPTEKKYNVAYLINGNLGDKSFFDSANEGLTKLKNDGRITLRTIEMGGSDSDKPKWLSTLYEVSESEEYDVIIVGTFQMPDFLKEVATEYPEQKYIIFDDNTYVGNNNNVMNLMYKQNELGYVVGVLAGSVTTETSIKDINPEPVIGFVGGVDSPVINDFLIGYIEGARSVNPNVKIDTRYTNDYVDTAKAKEFGLSMIKDQKADLIWGVAGNAGNGAAEAILENGKAWFIGVDSDQEATFSSELAAITLTSGLKNIGNSLIWVFDELDAGKTYWGTEISLGLSDGGVGLVTDKNFDKVVTADIKAAVTTAIEAVQKGTVKVSTALGDSAADVATIRESVIP
ncbi:MAG: BMP family ABC transporter substrate-binding protein [Erysipelothrix sp.]|nr:BMP family ABC transporter substrate-binding protein [Erysipelothrix sp.]